MPKIQRYGLDARVGRYPWHDSEDGDWVRYADYLAAVKALEDTSRGWLKENAPGGWIDNLRVEVCVLMKKLARMQQPVSDEEWQSHNDSLHYDSSITRRGAVDELIAARAAEPKEEPNA